METTTPQDTAKIHRCQCRTCLEGLDPLIGQHHQQINLLLSRLNEPQRRWYVATLAAAPEAPSDRELSRITGLDEKTILRARREMQDHLQSLPVGRQRQPGGGRPSAPKKTPI